MKKWLGIIGVLLIFAFAGCIKMEQEVTINKDGSGEGEMTYAMSEAVIQQMKSMAQLNKKMAEQQGQPAPEEKEPFEFDEAKVKENFEALKDKGITLKGVKTETKDGWKYITVKYSFKDISKIKEMDEFKEDSFSITKNPEGNYVVSLKMAGKEMGPGMENEEQLKAMLPMIQGQGMFIAMKINTPGKIIETNAPIKGKKSAGFEIDVDKNPDSLLKFSKLGNIKIVFDGQGCTIPEVK